MLLPLLSVVGLFLLSACGRSKSPCPEGAEDYPVRVDGNQIHLCHQEGGTPDGLYQKDQDRLGVQVGDRFIGADEEAFKSYREKFRLPNFEGVSLKNWASLNAAIFPEGATGAEADRWLSLQNYLSIKNLNPEKVLSLARKIPWLNAQSRPQSWEKTGPAEKLDGLALAEIVMGMKAGPEEFSGTEENRRFIETVFTQMEKGRLRLQKQTKALNGLIEMTGLNRSAGYYREKNTLLLGLPLNLDSLPSISNYVHELFHFYQDASKAELNFLQVESGAYTKQGEFVARSLKAPPYR